MPVRGEVVYSGYDEDEDGALDVGEETQNFIICQGAPGDGKTALVTSSQADLNDCPTGGRRVEVGLDDDQSGALEADEILDAFTLCNGEPGPRGEAGADGASALIEVTVGGASGCPAGGNLVEVGVDGDGDGTLSGVETTGSFEVCHGQDGDSCSVMDNGDGTSTVSCTDGTSVTLTGGADGQDGDSCSVSSHGDGTSTLACTDGTSVTLSDGAHALVSITRGGAQTCPAGGDLLEVGADDDGDGVLSAAEVDDSFEVCDGAQGASGADGQDGVDGQDGAASLIAVTRGGAQTCPAGGDLLEVGADDDGDGTLDAGEVDASLEVCQGRDGLAGQDGSSCTVVDHGDGTKTLSCTDGTSVTLTDGQDGSDSLLEITPGAATSCGAAGGDLVEVGVDANGDGVLDASEVSDSFEVCDGQAGAAGLRGQDGQDGLTALLEITAGGAVSCPSGGDRLEVGLDADADGVLDTGEVDASFEVCQGRDGKNALLETIEGAATTCPHGGDRVNAGVDDDGDGTLDASEIDSSIDVCDGADGVQGQDGRDVLLETTAGGAMACPAGGDLVQAGLDDDGDGVLDASEVSDSFEVCDGQAGAAGQDGQSGYDSLLKVTEEPAGMNCPEGGQKIEVGLDTNRNGALDVAEIDASQTTYICNPGSSFATGQVTAGSDHSCFLNPSGALKCWGNNGAGQLGYLGTTRSSVPLDTRGMGSGVASVAAGDVHTCALLKSGGVKCWGEANDGQLGNGATGLSSSTPVSVTGLSSGVEKITAGWDHTCALLTSGGVKCWGLNSSGQLGDGTTTTRSRPRDVIGLSSGVVDIIAGGFHTCALLTSGGAKCWGDNGAGQLGDGTRTTPRLAPVDVVVLTSGVQALAAGNGHTCALTTAGDVECWGLNTSGQLGDGGASGVRSLTPVGVNNLGAGVAQISAGSAHTCARLDVGSVQCWGDNGYGQLGDGTTTDRTTPVSVSNLGASVTDISGGRFHTCAVISSWGVRCWGENASGQLGDSSTTDRSTPVDVRL